MACISPPALVVAVALLTARTSGVSVDMDTLMGDVDQGDIIRALVELGSVLLDVTGRTASTAIGLRSAGILGAIAADVDTGTP